MSGDPVTGSQMRAYLAAERFGRNGRIKRWKTTPHFQRGTSIPRGSERNWRRYGRSASAVGASGVPSWIRRTPCVCMMKRARSAFRGAPGMAVLLLLALGPFLGVLLLGDVA